MTQSNVVTFKPIANPSIDILIDNFKQLQQNIHVHDKLERELKKLELMKAVHALIEKDFDKKLDAIDLQLQKKDSNVLKKILYYFFLLGGFVQQASASYIYGYYLFSLISSLSNFWLIIIGVVYTLLDCILFYAFQADLLKTALGLEFTSPDSLRLLETYEEQLRFVTLMNRSLSSLLVITSGVSSEKYKEYVECVKLFNHDLLDKEAMMGQYHESIWRKSFKYGMYIFGILSTVAANYFTAHALLVSIGSGLSGSVLGWIIIVLLTVSSLAFYYAMEGKSLYHMANPDYKLFKDVKKDLLFFKDEESHKLDDAENIVSEYWANNRSSAA